MRMQWIVSALASLAFAGCGGGSSTSPERQALVGVKGFITTNLDDLYSAVVALQEHAPAADTDGWSNTTDTAAVDAMKADWKKARTAYEHVEGAIAVLFPDLDISTDERYDGFLQGSVDNDLFDDQGVTGIHAIERILWSDSIPAQVKTFEEGIPGYKAAAFPANQEEAQEFKEKLCARLVADVNTMKTQFAPLALDTASAYRGVIGSMNEQVEKADKASSGEEESRYAQYTLADMRANVAAGALTYNQFRGWIIEKGGNTLDAQIQDGFQKIQAKYDSYPGDALPPVPATWSNEPTAADLATPFGQLFQLLSSEANPDMPGSLVNAMNQSADLIGIPRLPE
jgi:iron uptake system component EfeO